MDLGPCLCNCQKDGHADFWLRVNLALVLPHVPQLRVLDLQGPGVRQGGVEAGEPGVPGEGDHVAGQDMERGFSDPRNSSVSQVPDCTPKMCSLAHYGGDIALGRDLKVRDIAAIGHVVLDMLVHSETRREVRE